MTFKNVSAEFVQLLQGKMLHLMLVSTSVKVVRNKSHLIEIALEKLKKELK